MTLRAKGLLFDLDGTLVESFPDIALAVNLTLQQLGMAAVDEQRIQNWVGNGSPMLMKRALTGEMDGEPDSDLFARAMPLFFEFYATHSWHRSFLYDGVVDTLQRFQAQGFKMACVTNKPARHTELVLRASGLSAFFGCFIGGDSLPNRKPDPAPLRHAARQIGVRGADCIMVGDSLSDILAAKAAKMPVLCLTYGYNQGIDLSSHGPDALVDHFTDLIQLVQFETSK